MLWNTVAALASCKVSVLSTVLHRMYEQALKVFNIHTENTMIAVPLRNQRFNHRLRAADKKRIGEVQTRQVPLKVGGHMALPGPSLSNDGAKRASVLMSFGTEEHVKM